MSKMICFDMDGTIADFYGFENWLNYLIAEDATPYEMCRPLVDMNQLRRVLLKLKSQGWEIRVISWLAKDSSTYYKDAVRAAKRKWLESYNFPMDACHLIAYGTTKANCVRKYLDGAPAILIDDNEQVRNGWHLGSTIDPQEEDVIGYLEDLLI